MVNIKRLKRILSYEANGYFSSKSAMDFWYMFNSEV